MFKRSLAPIALAFLFVGCQNDRPLPQPAVAPPYRKEPGKAFIVSAVLPQPAVAPPYRKEPGKAFIVSAVLPKEKETLESAKKLQQLSIALINFQDQTRYFPRYASYDENGKPLLSWRVHLLPFLSPEARELYDEFRLDEPWDSEHNRQLISRMPVEFQTPNFKVESGRTCYLAPVGDDINGASSLIPIGGAVPDKHCRGRKIDDITDGPAKTAALVEVEASRSVIWTEPKDFPIDQKNPSVGLASSSDNEFLVSMGNAAVYQLPLNMSSACFLHLFLCDDGMTIEPL